MGQYQWDGRVEKSHKKSQSEIDMEKKLKEMEQKMKDMEEQARKDREGKRKAEDEARRDREAKRKAEEDARRDRDAKSKAEEARREAERKRKEEEARREAERKRKEEEAKRKRERRKPLKWNADAMVLACQKGDLDSVKAMVEGHDVEKTGMSLDEMVSKEGKDSDGDSSHLYKWQHME